MMDKIQEIKSTLETEHGLYTKLASSICPEIFSMDEVK
jgi:DNA replicative helicase MCM subunit Mcm2 (Cdc46/Mcm family)